MRGVGGQYKRNQSRITEGRRPRGNEKKKENVFVQPKTVGVRRG